MPKTELHEEANGPENDESIDIGPQEGQIDRHLPRKWVTSFPAIIEVSESSSQDFVDATSLFLQGLNKHFN